MANPVHRFACATDNDGFPECMGDGSTCGPDGCLGLQPEPAERSGPGICHCRRLLPISCGSQITAEDLLCDDCRAGCNTAFGSMRVMSDSPEATAMGFHMRTEFLFGDGSVVITNG